MHSSRLLADRQAGSRHGKRPRIGLDGGFLLSLPRFKVRPGGACSEGCTGTGQSESPALQVPERYAPEDRRRQRSLSMSKAQALLDWIDHRFPLSTLWKSHVSEYYAPKNFNFWYYFGSLAMLVLVIQIASGIFLTMHYKPDAQQAFQSVEYIMRDVEGGW